MPSSSSVTLYERGDAKMAVSFDAWGVDRTVPRFLTAVTAIAWYNALILLGLIFCVFKRYSGLYFWSLLITTISVIPYATGENTYYLVIILMTDCHSRRMDEGQHSLSECRCDGGPPIHWVHLHGTWPIVGPLLPIAPRHREPHSPPRGLLVDNVQRGGSVRPNGHVEFSPTLGTPRRIHKRLSCHGQDRNVYLHRARDLHIMHLSLGGT